MRKEVGLTQKQLSKKANTTQANIANIEKGKNISLSLLNKIVKAMDKNIEIKIY